VVTQRDPFDLVGTVLDTRFAVESVVSISGLAVVYAAKQQPLDRLVALKLLRVEETRERAAGAAFEAAFVREARLAAALRHPGLVTLLDFGVTEIAGHARVPWMALEWVEGETLDVILRARGDAPFTREESLALLGPVLEALDHAHSNGVAHRDVKPANIMCARTLSGIVTRLLDLGIAKEMREDDAPGSGETATQSRLTMFTLAYAAPEQVGGTRTGPWTDVHAVALVATELLTGRRPYPSGDRTETCAAILSAQRPTPAAFGVDAGAWEPVLRAALSLRPADRPSSAGELLRDLVEAGVRSGASASTSASAPASVVIRPVAARSRAVFALVAVPLLGLLAVTALWVAGAFSPQVDRAEPRSPEVVRPSAIAAAPSIAIPAGEEIADADAGAARASEGRAATPRRHAARRRRARAVEEPSARVTGGTTVPID